MLLVNHKTTQVFYVFEMERVIIKNNNIDIDYKNNYIL